MEFTFSGEVWTWRGPAPFYFVTVPIHESTEIKAIERLATYGWGMIPVKAVIGDTCFETALWPKDGNYVLPLKDKVRKAEGIDEGSHIQVHMSVVIAEPD